MLKLLKKYSLPAIIFAIFLATLFWCNTLCNRHLYTDNQYNSKNIFLTISIFFIFIFAFHKLTSKIFIFETSNVSYAIIMTILSGYIYIQQFSTTYLSILLISGGLFLIYKSIETQNSIKSYLSASLLFMLAIILTPSFFIFLFFLPIAAIIQKSTLTKDFIVTLIGYATIFVLYLEIYFLKNSSLPNFSDIIPKHYNTQLIKHNYLNLYFLIIFILTSLVSFIDLLKKIPFRELEIRQFFSLNNIFLALSVINLLIIKQNSIIAIVPVFISASFVIANYFSLCKENLINKILFFLFLTSPFVLQVGLIIFSS